MESLGDLFGYAVPVTVVGPVLAAAWGFALLQTKRLYDVTLRNERRYDELIARERRRIANDGTYPNGIEPRAKPQRSTEAEPIPPPGERPRTEVGASDPAHGAG